LHVFYLVFSMHISSRVSPLLLLLVNIIKYPNARLFRYLRGTSTRVCGSDTVVQFGFWLIIKLAKTSQCQAFPQFYF
jgi:hypothetical protein